MGGILLTSLLASLSIEVVQHFIGRCFDIDDVILNVAGGIIGFLVYIALDAIGDHLPKFMKKNWFYNILTLLILLAGIIFLIKIL